jgi:hypothetical protein
VAYWRASGRYRRAPKLVLPSPLSVLVAFAGCGAFIDFWMGKNGQRNVRDRLETWWLILSDVSIHTFGRDEAIYSDQAIKAVFGSFCSVKRLLASIIIGLIALVLWASVPFLTHTGGWKYFDVSMRPSYVVGVPVTILLFSLSISFTIFGAKTVANAMTSYTLVNIIIFVFVLILQYLLMSIWPEIIELFTSVIEMTSGIFLEPAGYVDTKFISGYVSSTFIALASELHKLDSPFSIYEAAKRDLGVGSDVYIMKSVVS